jgi:hypothetical protein
VPGGNGKRGGESDMTILGKVSSAVRVGFWLFTLGVVLGVVIGLQV